MGTSFFRLLRYLGVEVDIGLVPAVILGIAELVALLSVPSVLLQRRGRPQAALAWLLALFAFPLGGIFAWWLFGRTHLRRKRRSRTKSTKVFRERQQHMARCEEGTALDGLGPARAFGRTVWVSQGNDVRLLINGRSAFPEMERAIAAARHTIHVLYYIWNDDATGRRIRDLLAERARAGCKVRVLVDAVGSSHFLGKFADPLRAAGAHVAAFLPPRFRGLRAPAFNFRNHRKILVVDHEVAFTGGMNIGDEYAYEWLDISLSLRGPAVGALEHVLLEDWFFATGEHVAEVEPAPVSLPCKVTCAVIASGPDAVDEWIHDAFFVALTRAERRIWLATPYFIPSHALTVALRTAAARGVDVRIVVPARSDVRLVRWASRAYYRELLLAGAHIFEYEGQMLHAKALVVDDNLAVIGTANVDNRSFKLNFEIGCFLHSEALNRELARWHEETVADSLRVRPRDLAHEPVLQTLRESAAHLLSPLL
ncbi:MAG: cardiolipin synthase [Polyangiaceae bacterium]|nr:cardiolipin synthase [Polyangiaceae bacterium]